MQEGNSGLSIGVLVDIEWPLDRVRDTIDVANAYDFNQIWVNEHPQDWDPFVLLNDIAARSTNRQLGIGTINPWTRHPAVIAASASTVAATTGRHFNLGIGSGAPPLFPPIGVELRNVVNGCREAILLIRELLAGNEITIDGQVFNTNQASISPNLASTNMTVLLGVSGGPKMLNLAGEVADGIVIPAGNMAFYESMLSDYGDARKRFNRTGLSRIVLNGNVMVETAKDGALEQRVRQRVAAALAYRLKSSQFSLTRMQIDVEDAQVWSEDPSRIPADVLASSAIWGDAEECARRLKQLGEIGITDFCLRFPSIDELKLVGDRVLPLLRP